MLRAFSTLLLLAALPLYAQSVKSFSNTARPEDAGLSEERLRRIDMDSAGRLGDGVVERAEAIDQADLAGSAAVPNPSLGDFMDSLRGANVETGGSAPFGERGHAAHSVPPWKKPPAARQGAHLAPLHSAAP